MSFLDRLLGRSAGADARTGSGPDALVERWALGADDVAAGLGPGGRFVVAVLGESLAGGQVSPWLGHEPGRADLAAVLSAVGEEPWAADILADLEAPLASGRPGSVSSETRARWHDLLVATARDATDLLPDRDPLHLEAEQVWRTAARGVQEWRADQLDPDAALRQVRWFPGCATRTSVGYADPLGLATVRRAVEEHRWSEEEWQALEPAVVVAGRSVDPLVWRLSSLSFAARALAGR